MIVPKWTSLVTDRNIDAPKDALWVKVVDYVRGPRKIKVEVTGSWNYDAGKTCGPDGSPSEGLSDANLNKSALKGCVIGKVGGSPGDTPGSDKLFAPGSYAVFEIGDVAGALYLGMNDVPTNIHNHAGTVRVNIWEAP
jgi:hypothetical protein